MQSDYLRCLAKPLKEEFKHLVVFEIPQPSYLKDDNFLWEIVRANNLGGCWGNVASINNFDLRQCPNNATDVILAEVDDLFIERLVALNNGRHFEGSCGHGAEEFNYLYFEKKKNLEMYVNMISMPEITKFKLLKLFMNECLNIHTDCAN